MQDFLQRGMELAEFGFRECVGPAARPDVRAEQGFIGIDVSHSVEQLLVQQRSFYGCFAAMEELRKIFRANIQRLSTRTAKSAGAYLKPPEAPRIDKAQLTAGSQFGYQMGMLGRLYFRGGNQHLARHAQVNDPLPAGGLAGAKIKDNMLADAAYLIYIRAFQNG